MVQTVGKGEKSIKQALESLKFRLQSLDLESYCETQNTLRRPIIQTSINWQKQLMVMTKKDIEGRA